MRWKFCGNADGKNQLPAIDHKHAATRPAHAAASGMTAMMLNTGKYRSILPSRQPPRCQELMKCRHRTSTAYQMPMPITARAICRIAPNDAGKRAAKSASRNPCNTKMASGGGNVGASSKAISTTDKLNTRTAKTGRRICR